MYQDVHLSQNASLCQQSADYSACLPITRLFGKSLSLWLIGNAAKSVSNQKIPSKINTDMAAYVRERHEFVGKA